MVDIVDDANAVAEVDEIVYGRKNVFHGYGLGNEVVDTLGYGFFERAEIAETHGVYDLEKDVGIDFFVEPEFFVAETADAGSTSAKSLALPPRMVFPR